MFRSVTQSPKTANTMAGLYGSGPLRRYTTFLNSSLGTTSWGGMPDACFIEQQQFPGNELVAVRAVYLCGQSNSKHVREKSSSLDESAG